MKTVLIIHGIGGYAGIHWQRWLHDELLRRNLHVLMPNLPNPQKPDRKEWLSTVLELTRNINPSDLIIVGHSLGVATAMDMIEAVNKKVSMLVSVSGLYRDYGLELNSYFLKKRNINMAKVKSLISKVVIVYGDNDPYVLQDMHQKLSANLDVKPLVIKSGGHLNTDAGFSAFPLLLNIIIRHAFDIYKAAGIILKERKLLLLKSSNQDVLLLPGGKIEENETSIEALIREIFEELAINIEKNDLELFDISTGESIGRNNKDKLICMESYLIKKWKGNLSTSHEIKELIWVNSKNISLVDNKSITRKILIPKLLEMELIA